MTPRPAPGGGVPAGPTPTGGGLPAPRNLGRTVPAPSPAPDRTGFRSDLSAGRTDPNETLATELDGMPGLAGAYARGVAGSVAMAARRDRRVRADALSPARMRVRGVRADADHLTAYQHLLGEPAADALPPGFVHVLAFPLAMSLLADDAVPLPLLGMVHLSNRITQQRALRLDEALDITVGTGDLRPHRSGVSVDVVAEVADACGDVVWRGVSTYLAKGYRLDDDPANDDPTDGAPADGGPADAGPVGGASVPGSDAAGADADHQSSRPTFTPPVPTGQWRLRPDVARRYAVVSGDRNPIHLSSVAAKAFGFPRRIAHGMYTAARALADVGPRVRGEAFTWEVEFARPVLLPSTVAVRIAPGATSGAAGTTMTVWDPRRGKPHLLASVHPSGCTPRVD